MSMLLKGKFSSVINKLILPVFTIVLVMISIQSWLNISSAIQRDEKEEEKNLFSIYNDYQNEASFLKKESAALANTIADRPDVQELLITRDRKELLTRLTPIYNNLKTNYQIVHLFLDLPNGYVFLRVHDPSNFGDSMVNYRETNIAALKNHSTEAGVELDPNRLGVSGVAPIFQNKEFIGLVEVGLDFDQTFINDLKKRSEADYKIWISYDAAAPTGLWPKGDEPPSPSSQLFYYAGTSTKTLPISEIIYNQVLQEGKITTQFVNADHQAMAVLLAPLYGYAGEILGVLEISNSRADVLAALQRDQINSLIISGGLTVLALVLMGFVVQRVVKRPLQHLTAIAHHQIEGDLTARVDLPTFDEFGQLGITLNRLTEALQESIHDLESQVEIVRQTETDIRILNAKLEQRVKERTMQLEDTNFELEAFVYSVSHDLRAPLRRITGFSQVLEEDYGDLLDNQAKEYLQRIQTITRNMGDLIEALLRLSRVTRIELQVKDVDMSAVARQIAADLMLSQPDRKVEFIITPDLVVKGDAKLVDVMLVNLLGNAWKFTGKHPTARIELGTILQNGEKIYFVRDDGAGFDPSNADRLFGVFQRLHKTKDFEGTGIGLALVARITRRHGGRIWAEGKLEGGATFYFTL
jgi:signal transduction histidine kinase